MPTTASNAALAAQLPNWATWRSESSSTAPEVHHLLMVSDNTAKSWWNDEGLRHCMLNIIILYGAIFAYGYDGAFISTVQALPRWNE